MLNWIKDKYLTIAILFLTVTGAISTIFTLGKKSEKQKNKIKDLEHDNKSLKESINVDKEVAVLDDNGVLKRLRDNGWVED